ncbi:MAG: DnaD domain-containing protein [Dehalococcoidia bacterium]
MSEIQDLAELKTVLYVAYLILRKQQPSLMSRHSEDEMRPKRLSQAIVSRASSEAQGMPDSVTFRELLSHDPMAAMGDESLRRALDSAVEHGALLRSTSDVNGVREDLYFLTPPMYEGRQSAGVRIFSLYEQNIGMITPMIAEELQEAERLYPPRWIEEAFREAVVLNKRSWKYIARILERWASEGKDSGEHKGNVEKGGPDKYIKGKYGHLVKR